MKKRFDVAALVAALFASSAALADNTNGPNPYAPGFGFDTPQEASWGSWTRGAAGTIYVEWDSFVDASAGGLTDRTAAADAGSHNAAGATASWNAGTFQASTGNLYNFSSAQAFELMVAGGGLGGPVRAVLQTEGWGTLIEPSTVKLNGIAPTLATTTYVDPAYNSSFGVVALTQSLYYWDFAAAPGGFDFDFGTAGPHLSLAQVAVDIGPVAAVPEPGEWAMMLAGLGAIGVIARRRRKI